MTTSLNMIPWLVVSLGFLGGGILLLLGDKLFDFLTKKEDKKKSNENSSLKRSVMLIASITLHNIPDGLCFM